MDIDLLSKIVKELILDNDEVALPGIGSFIAEIVPSVFSDKGYTINPPYRRLSFRQKGSGDENMVIDFYARCNNIDTPTASRIIREFLEEMRRVLETKKSIVFPGLGKLRATKENYFFFSAFPMEGRAEGVCEHGSYYELDNAELTAAYPLGVSNEYAEGSDCITISTRSGALVAVETIPD